MSEIHQEIRNGWNISVWMSGHSLNIWNYVATKREMYRAGWVTAVNRNEAVTNALMDIGEWQ
jgi:hypothetical protein